MHMVLWFLNPDQVIPSFSKERCHEGQHAQGTAGGADLVYGELQSWLMLHEVDPVFGLARLPKVDLRRKPQYRLGCRHDLLKRLRRGFLQGEEAFGEVPSVW